MGRAMTNAGKAESAGEVPVGAVLVKADEVVGEGWNQMIQQHDPGAHAEMLALRSAGTRLGNYRLPGCVLYVTLEPCCMCAGAIIHARLDRVVFAASDQRTGAAGGCFPLLQHPSHNHKPDIEGGCLAQASGEMLKQFFRQRRK